MGLKIYNSLSNKVEEFIPIHEGKVNMYVCGPTVYNHIHIGNARPVVFYDMLKKYWLLYIACYMFCKKELEFLLFAKIEKIIQIGAFVSIIICKN